MGLCSGNLFVWFYIMHACATFESRSYLQFKKYVQSRASQRGEKASMYTKASHEWSPWQRLPVQNTPLQELSSFIQSSQKTIQCLIVYHYIVSYYLFTRDKHYHNFPDTSPGDFFSSF
jgi:hypothetical protein